MRCGKNEPEKIDTYLVLTEEGIYGFAFWDDDGWHREKMSDGTPKYWMEIPTIDDYYISEDTPPTKGLYTSTWESVRKAEGISDKVRKM